MYNPNEECERVIENIKHICVLKAISYYAVAIKAEISSSTMHSLMSGKTKPYLHTLFKICNALEVNVEDVICGNIVDGVHGVSQKNILSDESELLLCYRLLSDKKKKMLRAYIDMLSQYKCSD